jgi:hypothetical protein
VCACLCRKYTFLTFQLINGSLALREKFQLSLLFKANYN